MYFRDVEVFKGCYTKKYHEHVLVVLLIRLFVLMIDLVSQLLFIEEKIQLMNLLKQFLKNISTVKKSEINNLTKI